MDGRGERLGLLVYIEGEREIEHQVSDGDAQGKFAGAGVAGKPDGSGGFLLRRQRTGLQSKSAWVGGVLP